MLLNSIKRYLSFLLAIALMFSCLPVSALAAEDYLPEENHRAEGSALESTGEEAVVDATAETTAASVETAEEKLLRLQAEMNTILIKYLGATALSEEEIIDIVVNMPWTDMEAALADKARLELDFSSLTEAEIDALNAAYTGAASIACFYETIEATMTPAFFATSGTHTPVTGITVSVSGATDNSMSSGNVTVTAKGSGGFFGIGASAKTATITIKNDTAESSTIAFDWTASSVNELKIDGTVYTGTSGSFSKLFTAGASITVTITTAKNGTTNKLVMNNFSLTKASTAYNVKFISDSGSISVNGETVASGTTKPITAAGSTLSTSASNFVAWINAESRELLSQNSSYTLQPKADMTVRAVISTNAWFLVNGKYVYDDLNAAVSHTGASIVVLLNSGTLVPSTSSDGVYTIPSTVTLLIPFDAAHTLITNDMEKHVASSNDTQTLFRQLTMPSGTSITVNGAISISSRASRQMVGQVGPYGAIVMDEGSSISIENGASLYAYGYIFAGTDGAGMITVKDGGTVYEDIMSLDYPGSLSSTIDLFNNYKIFPLRSFSIRNVEVPMTLNSGAKEYVFYCIYSGTFKKNFPGTELVISSDSSSPFQLKEGTTLTKSYSGGKQYVKINGSGGLNPLSVTLQGTTISSEDTTGFPIPSGFDIELASGTITMGGHVIMTEGSKITIGSEATVETNGKNLYVLDATEDAGAVSKTDVHKTQYTQVNSDAVLDVNGVLNTGATFYTSTSGACITSSKGGGKINIATAPADTKVYVKMSTSSQKNIEVTSAQLLNSNGGYVKTAKEGADTYTYLNGFWHKGTSCDGGTATCTAKAKCSTCGKEYGDLGKHTEVIDTATNPKWDAAGLTEGKHCSVCKTVIVKQQEIAAAKVGNEEYSILKDAIDAADRSTPVTLLHDIDGDIPVNKAVTIHKGDYTAKIIADTGFTLSEDASAKTATVLIRIMATNIVAGDGLDIYFYVLKSALGSETGYYAKAVRTRQGAEDEAVRIEGNEYTTGGTTYVRFRYADIAAKEMTDTVTMSLRYSDGTQASNSYTESIKDYAIRTLNNSNSSDKLKTALMDMLNYGAAAQDYFGDYNIETLANAGSEVEKYTSFATVNAPAVANGLVKGDNLKAVSVSAKNKLMMTFYFANITQEMTAKISYEGLVEPIEIKGKDFFAYNSWYGVDVTGLPIADGRKLVTCEVYDGGTLLASASDSVEGYVARNGSGVLVLQQLMKFVDSAYAYFR